MAMEYPVKKNGVYQVTLTDRMEALRKRLKDPTTSQSDYAAAELELANIVGIRPAATAQDILDIAEGIEKGRMMKDSKPRDRDPVLADNPYQNTKAELKKKTQRVPTHLVCSAGIAHEAQAMRDGYLKYGYASFLNGDVKMTALDCIGAAIRHLERLKSGEDYAPDKYGAHHAGHARAMLGIFLECMEQGKLIDDRHEAGKKQMHGEDGAFDKRSYIGRMFDRMASENEKRDAE